MGGQGARPGRKGQEETAVSAGKQRRSSRKVAAVVGVSQSNVMNYLKKFGARVYHRRKVQSMMSEEHKISENVI